HAQNDFLTFGALPDGCDIRGGRRIRRHREFVVIDADGIVTDYGRQTARPDDEILFHPAYTGARQTTAQASLEVADIARRLKSDQVVVHQAEQDFRPPRQRLENIRSRKGYVMKVRDPPVKAVPPQRISH